MDGGVNSRRSSCRRRSVRIERVVLNADQEETSELLEHVFRLRTDLAVAVDLPADITEGEAGRLADFIKALPLIRSRLSGKARDLVAFRGRLRGVLNPDQLKSKGWP